jgi:ABC-2 type transport system permease protein
MLQRIQLTSQIMLNETYKRLLIFWDYKFEVVMQLLVIALIFIGTTFFLHLGTGQLPAQLLGYLVWIYARIILLTMGNEIMEEAQSGTLEQMYMSPIATEWLLLGRMLAQLISTTILALIPATGLLLLLHISIPLRWESLPVLGLTLAGLFGFTLILTGLGLVFKQIDSAADLIQNLLLFLTGSFVPVSLFPGWLEAIARTLPTTQGIIVLRSVTLQGQSLAEVWASGSLGWLIVHTCLYLCTGWLVFKLCERYARRLGSLGQY